MSDHPIGSFEWAKQIVTAANTAWEAERRVSMLIGGSPQLDQPKRSRHEAALDIAVAALRAIKTDNHAFRKSVTAKCALDKIAALVPEAVP